MKTEGDIIHDDDEIKSPPLLVSKWKIDDYSLKRRLTRSSSSALITSTEFVTKEAKVTTVKSRFSVKSQFKEWRGADGGHSLNRDFTVFNNAFNG